MNLDLKYFQDENFLVLKENKICLSLENSKINKKQNEKSICNDNHNKDDVNEKSEKNKDIQICGFIGNNKDDFVNRFEQLSEKCKDKHSYFMFINSKK